MVDRPDYVEIHATDWSDAGRVAMPVHPYATTRRLRADGHKDEPSELGWTWASPEPVDDLVPTADGIRLVSPRLREIFDAHLGPDDEIQWLPGTVTLPDGTALPHWSPHFPVHDLLNHELSTFGPSGLPIVYVLSRAKLAGHAVTALPGNPLTTIISATVADALLALDLVGVDFMNVPIGP
ncbi:hypothetical protein [Cellulomonas sp. URHD0024]|uniref:hypothetical protein n=1 Tax=Cellulomonas sp. URHD0024 TaxID=1302620 RepID=UPI00041AB539|nr:hypothetical protein [Cellulomonas sp. URHD0024]